MNRILSLIGIDYQADSIFEQALDAKQSLSFVCPYKREKSWLSRAGIRLNV